MCVFFPIGRASTDLFAKFSLLVNTFLGSGDRTSTERIFGEALWLSMYLLTLNIIFNDYLRFRRYHVDFVARNWS